jgi:hypothetical protein
MSCICDLFGACLPLSLDFSANKLRASKVEVEIRIPAVAQSVLLAHLPDWCTDVSAFKTVKQRLFNNRTALFWIITYRVIIIYCRRFGTTYRSCFRGSKLQKKGPSPNTMFIQERVKLAPIGCPETSAVNYHYSLRNNSEGRSSNPLRGRSLKSVKDVSVLWFYILRYMLEVFYVRPFCVKSFKKSDKTF